MESLFPDVQSSTTEEPTTINLLASKSTGQRLKCKLPTVLALTAGDNVEVVQSFTYHGVEIHNTGSSEPSASKLPSVL